jgi:hypothetical protein
MARTSQRSAVRKRGRRAYRARPTRCYVGWHKNSTVPVHVLVVEDDADSRDSLDPLLTWDTAWPLLPAAEALRHANSTPLRRVITDADAGDVGPLTGRQGALSRAPPAAMLKAVALTACAVLGALAKRRESGADTR